jgi:hypothetical protein
MMVPGAGHKGDHPQEKQQQDEDDGEREDQIRSTAQAIAELR